MSESAIARNARASTEVFVNNLLNLGGLPSKGRWLTLAVSDDAVEESHASLSEEVYGGRYGDDRRSD